MSNQRWLNAVKDMDDEVALTLHAMDLRVSELAPTDEHALIIPPASTNGEKEHRPVEASPATLQLHSSSDGLISTTIDVKTTKEPFEVVFAPSTLPSPTKKKGSIVRNMSSNSNATSTTKGSKRKSASYIELSGVEQEFSPTNERNSNRSMTFTATQTNSTDSGNIPIPIHADRNRARIVNVIAGTKAPLYICHREAITKPKQIIGRIQANLQESLFTSLEAIQGLIQAYDAIAKKDEFVIQHLFDQDRYYSWININQPLVEQGVGPNSNLVLVPLSQMTKTPAESIADSAVIRIWAHLRSSQKDTWGGAKRRYCILKDNFIYVYKSSLHNTTSLIIPLDFYTMTIDKIPEKCEIRLMHIGLSLGNNTPCNYLLLGTREDVDLWSPHLKERCATKFAVAPEELVFMKRKSTIFGNTGKVLMAAMSSSDKSDRTEKTEKPEKPEKPEKTEKTERLDRSTILLSASDPFPNKGMNKARTSKTKSLLAIGIKRQEKTKSEPIIENQSVLRTRSSSQYDNTAAKDHFYESISSFYTNETEEEKKKRMRGEVLAEIISSEALYLKNISAICKYMVDPANHPLVLTPSDAEHLFSNVKEILPVNQKLLRNLQGLEDLPLEEQRVGLVFKNLASELTIYEQYCLDQEKSMAMRERLLATPEFVKWVEETTNRHPEFGNTSIDNLLIQPLQRICRYSLLLKELQKHTPPDLPDYGDLSIADAAISGVIDRINTAKTQHERARKLAETKEKLLFDKPFQDFDLAENPEREFITDGPCRRVFAPIAKDKGHKGHLFLFNDLLVITFPPKDKKYLVFTWFELKNIRIAELDGSKYRNCFTINEMKLVKSTALEFNAEEDRTFWFTSINNLLPVPTIKHMTPRVQDLDVVELSPRAATSPRSMSLPSVDTSSATFSSLLPVTASASATSTSSCSTEPIVSSASFTASSLSSHPIKSIARPLSDPNPTILMGSDSSEIPLRVYQIGEYTDTSETDTTSPFDTETEDENSPHSLTTGTNNEKTSTKANKSKSRLVSRKPSNEESTEAKYNALRGKYRAQKRKNKELLEQVKALLVYKQNYLSLKQIAHTQFGYEHEISEVSDVDRSSRSRNSSVSSRD
eukprot:TRINITY_DN993_c0_g1_i3.p1 TRINITY_DN993_c0_g1~~TRINITY_DN993_c0_g1_i3.p1  ORF type:complete len:1104 (-),score=146.80 TRINITY_DN993_c0_g1_i3:229-3540(-)